MSLGEYVHEETRQDKTMQLLWGGSTLQGFISGPLMYLTSTYGMDVNLRFVVMEVVSGPGSGTGLSGLRHTLNDLFRVAIYYQGLNTWCNKISVAEEFH